MAVRIKCKCGKSLKISSKLADKALSCPGCGTKFRIPAAKFKTSASAAAAKPAPAAKAVTAKKPTAKPKSAAQKPKVVPAPAELDINPAELDIPGEISSSQSDILDGILPAAGGESSEAAVADLSGILDVLACPYCDEPLGFEAKICVSCGYDLRTGKVLHAAVGGIAAASAMSGSKEDVLATEEPVPTAEAVSADAGVAYAGDPLKSRKRSGMVSDDAIKGPTRGFWADAFASFAYPFKPMGNVITFVVIAVLVVIRVFLDTYGGCLGSIGNFIITGWLFALYLSVVTDTASGSGDMPGIKMEEGPIEDIFKPFFKYTGATVLPFLPALVLLIYTAISGSQSTALGLNLLLLMFAGAFVWPMSVMLFAFNALNMLIRIDLIFSTIFRTLLPYLGLWLMLGLVGSLSLLPMFGMILASIGYNVPIPELPAIGGMTGACVFAVMDVFLTIVSMRLIGLYYLHFKKRFTIVME